jgi:hypothetical protein
LGQFDLVNFGFETSMKTLESTKEILNDKALILAPISYNEHGSMEQTYTLLEYKNDTLYVSCSIFFKSLGSERDYENKLLTSNR